MLIGLKLSDFDIQMYKLTKFVDFFTLVQMAHFHFDEQLSRFSCDVTDSKP